MSTPGERLAEARRRAGYKTGSDAARAFGWPVSTYLGHENGDRTPRIDAAKRYGRAFRVPWTWILDGGELPEDFSPTLPVVGYVGAGAEVIPFDDHELGAGLDEVEAPPGAAPDAVVVKVRGQSMWPVFQDGDFIVFDQRRYGSDLYAYVGKECIVKLEDGRMFIKVLSKGLGEGFWTLTSYNAPPVEDVAVEWAAKVNWIQRA